MILSSRLHPKWQPRIELVRFKKIHFYPPPPTNLENRQEICIGTKTRTIGDALVLSTLPKKLKAKYPKLRITTYPRAFNPVVFFNHPQIDGVNYTPTELYGDDCNFDQGHLIELKENYFDLPRSKPPRPEIHLTKNEKAWAQAFFQRHLPPGKKLCLIHPWGHTWTQVAQTSYWSDVISSLQRESFSCWQLGIEGHEKLPGCDHFFLTKTSPHLARFLFALMERANLFIGVNSGPMHVACAFDVPSLILTEQGDPKEILAERLRSPWYCHSNWANGFLYPQNQHLDVPNTDSKKLTQQTLDFAWKHSAKFAQ